MGNTKFADVCMLLIFCCTDLVIEEVGVMECGKNQEGEQEGKLHT